jgi:hypothetical protein
MYHSVITIMCSLYDVQKQPQCGEVTSILCSSMFHLYKTTEWVQMKFGIADVHWKLLQSKVKMFQLLQSKVKMFQCLMN